MKKTFIKVTLFSLLAFGATSSLVSCKDYDDDITNIGQVNDDQAKQLAALETAVKAAQAAADAAAQKAEAAQQAAQQALTKGDQALAAAETAKADAAKAIQAAESAKADAIKAAMDAVEAALKNAPTQATIDALSTRISAIETSLNTLGGKVDAAQQAIEQLNIQVAALVKYQAEIEKLPQTLKDIADVQGKVSKIETTIAEIQSAQSQLQTQVGQNTQDIEKINKLVSDLSNKVDTIQTNLNILGKELRSLVFIPELYADGIEATEYPYMPYKPMTTDNNQKADGLTNQHNLECKIIDPKAKWAFKIGTKQQYYNPIEIVKYHINPSNAQVAADDLSLLLSSAETISRGLNTPTTGVTIINDQVKIENGIVSIPYETSGKDIKTGHELNGTYQNATLFRLEAKVNHAADGAAKTVTSDYALFYASTVHPLAVGYQSAPEQLDITTSYVPCTKNTKSPELFATMKATIEGGYSYEVQYNNTNGFDLTNLFNVHYDWATNTSNQGEHLTWTPEQAKKYGLTFQYELIDYTVGTNGTHDSKYGVIENGKFFPRTVDANGNTTGTTGVASIGREPIVRVTVVDGNNEVVVVGFVKLEIVKLVEVLTADFEKETAFNACDSVKVGLTWSEISSKVLDMTAASSKTEFDALYKLDVDANGEAIQYLAPSKKPEACKNPIGKISEVKNPTGTTTSVLDWKLSNAEQQYVYENNDKHTYTTYVRYICRDEKAQTAHPMIFVEWTVTVKKPVAGTIREKALTWWFGENKNSVYMNVPYPEYGKLPTKFERNQNSNWIDNAPKFTKVAGYPEGGYKYYFVGKQDKPTAIDIYGKKITGDLYVTNDKGFCINSCTKPNPSTSDIEYHLFYANKGVFTNYDLKSGKDVIASLDNTDGTLLYQENATAKDLLNKYGAANRDEATADNLHANVGIADTTDCGFVIPMNGDRYNCYFLRPITVKAVSGKAFTDAIANGDVINVADLLNFVDWRKVEFVNVEEDNYENVWLFGYYDIKGITIKLSDARASYDYQDSYPFWSMFSKDEVQLNAKDQDGNIVAGNVVGSTYVADQTISLPFAADYNNSYSKNKSTYEEIVKAMGTINFYNANGVTNGAIITFPIIVDYYWGSIEVKATVTVNHTLGN